MSSTRNEKWEKMPYAALKQILLGIAATPKDTAITFGTVCSRWRDVAINHSPDLWAEFYKRLEATDPGRDTLAATRAKLVQRNNNKQPYQRHTFAEYNLKRESFSLLSHYSRSRVHDIEGCTNDFAFSCPVLSNNLRVLDGVFDADTKLPIYFCDICKEKVYTAVNHEQLTNNALLGRCVIMEEVVADRMIEDQVLSQNCVNICFVVPKAEQQQQSANAAAASSSQQQQQQQNNISSSQESTASSTARNAEIAQHHHLITSHQLRKMSPAETARAFAREIMRTITKWSNTSVSAGALNQAHNGFYSTPGNFFWQTVEIDPAQDLAQLTKSNEGPLCNEKAPRAGGWTVLFVFPPADLASGLAPVGTQLHALQQTGRVITVTEAFCGGETRPVLRTREGLHAAALGAGAAMWEAMTERFMELEKRSSMGSRNPMKKGKMARPRPRVLMGQGPLPESRLSKGLHSHLAVHPAAPQAPPSEKLRLDDDDSD